MSKNLTEIHRISKKDNYSIIHNEVLRRKDLSWKAKGIMAYILSLPDNWEIYLEELETHATDGKDSFRSGWNELKKLGYVDRIAVRERGVIVAWKTIIKENVDAEPFSPLPDFPEVDKPKVDKPEMGKPEVENPKLPSTDLTNNLTIPSTDITNNNPSRKPAARSYDEDSAPYRLASSLLEEIRNNNPEARQPNLQSWADEIRKMMEIDGRKENQVQNMILWSQKDDFWKGVILSAKKLRDKYDQMKVQALNDKKPKSFSGRAPKVEELPHWATEEGKKEQNEKADELLPAEQSFEFDYRLYKLRNTDKLKQSVVDSFNERYGQGMFEKLLADREEGEQKIG